MLLASAWVLGLAVACTCLGLAVFCWLTFDKLVVLIFYRLISASRGDGIGFCHLDLFIYTAGGIGFRHSYLLILDVLLNFLA